MTALVSRLTGDGANLLGLALEHGGAVGLQPLEKAAMAENAIFDDFGIAGAEFAFGQRLQGVDIDEHQRRLMKGADEIFAMSGIDPGLAADRGIDLRQQAGGDLDKARAAPQACGDESGEIADDAAAQRQHDIAPFDLGGERLITHPAEGREGFRGLARLDDDAGGTNPAFLEALLQRREIVARDIGVGDNGASGAGGDPGDMTPGQFEQAGADDNVVGALAEGDADGFPMRGFQVVRRTRR